ncbi:MAG: amino acid deaminase [Rhodoferax sp.]
MSAEGLATGFQADPWLDARWKGYPHAAPALRCSHVGAQGWCVAADDLPLPLATLDRAALQHNLRWMQDFVGRHGLVLAPHGKTTLSPELWAWQRQAGAWGLTVADVRQARLAVASGWQRVLIANQVLADDDLHALQRLRQGGARVAFWVDSLAQLDMLQAWWQRHGAGAAAFEVLLELGVPGGRTGCRGVAPALALAQAVSRASACALVGVAAYEGLGVQGDAAHDQAYVQGLLRDVADLVLSIHAQGGFAGPEVWLSAGGSAAFDWVAQALQDLRQRLNAPSVGVLRSGCYLTHDHGSYQRLVAGVNARLGCGTGLQGALQVWTRVQSCPEPGLAILNAGKRDLSYDWGLPRVLRVWPHGAQAPEATHEPDPDWAVVALNDQHAYLRGSGPAWQRLRVGDRVVLGISHPCTTFDKWRWMPLLDAQANVVDAITTAF